MFRFSQATMVAVMFGLGACSPSAMIDKMVSAQDKKIAFALADMVCAPDKAPLKARFAPQLWAESEQQLKQTAPFCPSGPGKKRLVGYNWNINKSTDGSLSQKSFAVMTQSAGKWTMTNFSLEARNGGPEQVVQWSLNSSRDKPKDVAALDAFEEQLPVMRVVAIAALVLLIGLIIWAARRKPSKRAS
ncbi:MAG: hypothetical protein ACKVOJ_00780 [Sphingomonadaceae bacterium]